METEWSEGWVHESGRPAVWVRAAGVRASVVARKPGNAGGAKGRRKVDARGPCHRKRNWRDCLKRLEKLKKRSNGESAGAGWNLGCGRTACWQPLRRG